MRVRAKKEEAPLRVYVTDETCPACGELNMAASSHHMNCFMCGYQRPLDPQEIRTYTGALLRQERETGR